MPKPDQNTEEAFAEIEERGAQKTEDNMDRLFSGSSSSEEKPPKEKKPEPPADEEEEEESSEESADKDEEESEESSDDSEDTDWDADEQEEESDEDDEEDIPDESAARREAKKRGREAKLLKTQLKERELEVERLRREYEETQTRLAEIEAAKADPRDDPEYKEIRDGVLNDVREASELLPISDPESVVQNFGSFMMDYLALESLEGEDRKQARIKLKGSIVDRLKLSEIPYSELDEDERRALDSTVTEVMKVVQRNVGNTKKLQKIAAEVEGRAKVGILTVSSKVYQSRVSEFKPVLDAVGELADDVVETDPHSPAAVVARLVKSSPKAKERLEKARRDVLDVLAGPRALTKDEITKLESNGTSIREFMADREKAHQEKLKKLAPLFVQGLMTRSVLKDALKKLADYERDSDDDDAELSALKKTLKKRPKSTTKKKEEYIPPSQRPSAANKLFSDD